MQRPGSGAVFLRPPGCDRCDSCGQTAQLHRPKTGFPLKLKGSPARQEKYRSTAQRISLAPPAPPISVRGLTGVLKLISSKNETPAERKRSPDKSLCALGKSVVGEFGALVWHRQTMGLERDDERGGGGSYGGFAGRGRVDEDLPGSEARTG